MKHIRTVLLVLLSLLMVFAVAFSALAADSFVRGDVDGNGKVESKDYVKLKRYVLGTYSPQDNAELVRMNVDLKGGVDSKDYVMLKRVVLGTYSWPAEQSADESYHEETSEEISEEPCSHSWGEWKVTTAATETATGIETRYCKNCTAFETRVIPKAVTGCQHKNTKNFKQNNATCEDDGYTAYTKCSDCGEILSGHEPIPALGHEDSYVWNYMSFDFIDIIAYEPTCTTDGVQTGNCPRCGKILTRTVPAIGHNYVYYDSVTCEGGERGYACLNCGAKKDTVKVAATGAHDFSKTFVVTSDTMKAKDLPWFNKGLDYFGILDPEHRAVLGEDRLDVDWAHHYCSKCGMPEGIGSKTDPVCLQRKWYYNKTAEQATQEFLALLNYDRVIREYEPVTTGANIQKGATERAQEICALGKLDNHAGSHTQGECLALGQSGVQSAYGTWWNSDGHRFVMLTPSYTYAAFGFAGNGVIGELFVVYACTNG